LERLRRRLSGGVAQRGQEGIIDLPDLIGEAAAEK
jgi:hypothetical protein